MGCSSSSTAAEERQYSKAIDRMLAVGGLKMVNEVKLLFLGDSGAGKSTLFKQLRLLHGRAFLAQERALYKDGIQRGAIDGMVDLLNGMDHLNVQHLPGQETDDNAEFRGRSALEAGIDSSLGNLMEYIWSGDRVQDTYHRRHEFKLSDSAVYFLNHLHRLSAPEYVPSMQDLLHSRTRTTGIIEQRLDIGDLHFRLIDVGGERSQRRKWIQCFEDVEIVVYCVSLAWYNEAEHNQSSTAESATAGHNRMTQAIDLFYILCLNKWLENAYFFVFLNKIDVFEEKLQQIPLSNYFPGYTGAGDLESACNYFKGLFDQIAALAGRRVQVISTQATDTADTWIHFNTICRFIKQAKGV